MTMNPALRALPQALKTNLLSRGFFIAFIVFAIIGFSVPFGLTRFLPSHLPFPYTAIAASFVIDCVGLAFLLSALNERDLPQDYWTSFSAWLASVLVSGAAFGGLALARTHSESFHTFVILWLLFSAQAALAAALCGLLRVLFASRAFALQATTLLLGLAVTALFWSREPITMFSRAGTQHDNSAADRIANGVVKLSPPVALASAWNQECDAACSDQKGTRFDLIRAPLTYEVWIGSYQALPYPEILPSRQVSESSDIGAKEFRPGLVLVMLLWGIPLIIFSDMLKVSKQP